MFNQEADMFIKTTRPTGEIWMHESKPHWIVHYPATSFKGEFYQAYRAIDRVPAGRNAWTIDNERIGTKDGFATLDAAMHAAA